MGSVGGPVQIATFDRRYGRYRLVTSNGSVLSEMDKVAIVYSLMPDGSAHGREFGTPRWVMHYHQWLKGEYERIGLVEFANELRIAVSDSWTPEELNRARADNAFLTTLIHGTQGSGGSAGEAPGGCPAALPGEPQAHQSVGGEGEVLVEGGGRVLPPG